MRGRNEGDTDTAGAMTGVPWYGIGLIVGSECLGAPSLHHS